jgi:hypothetical protein
MIYIWGLRESILHGGGEKWISNGGRITKREHLIKKFIFITITTIIIQPWEEISMNDIRDRIGEMPERCKQVIERNGEVVKSNLW